MFNPFRPFLRLIQNFFNYFAGRADEQADEMMRRNPTLIRREFAAVKDQKVATFQSLYGAISGQVANRTMREQRIKTNGERLAMIAKARSLQYQENGRDPIQKMGFQLSQLLRAKQSAERKTKERAREITSEVAATDAELNRHKDNFARFATQANEVLAELAALEAQLQEEITADTAAVRKTNASLVDAKSNLKTLEREIAGLDGRAEDMIGDILGAEEAKRASDMMKSIDTSAGDNRLAHLERLRGKAVAEASVATEMTGSVIATDTEYLEDKGNVTAELDAMLSFKDDTPEDKHSKEAEQLPQG